MVLQASGASTGTYAHKVKWIRAHSASQSFGLLYRILSRTLVDYLLRSNLCHVFLRGNTSQLAHIAC